MAAPNNPKGAKSDKEWRDALRLALNEEYEDDGKKAKALRLVARAVVKKAIDGDIAAAKEIGDRLDGRPTQAVETSVERSYVARIPAPCETAEEWMSIYAPKTS